MKENHRIAMAMLAASVMAVAAFGCGTTEQSGAPGVDPEQGNRMQEAVPDPAQAAAPDPAPAQDPAKAAAPEQAPAAFDAPPAAGTRAFCPVMKNEFVVTEGSQRSEYKGKHYVFCCPGCKPKFDAEPEKYL